MNQRIFLDINSFSRHTGWAHWFMGPYAYFGGVVLLALLLLAGYLLARRRDQPVAVAAALWTGLASLIGLGISQIFNHAVQEPRPYVTLAHVLVLVPRTTDFAFPSDHAVVTGAVVAGLFLVDRRLAWTATVVGALLVFARVYVGAHYPGDVLAGLGIGLTVTLLGWLVVRPVLALLVRTLARTPLRPLLLAHPATGASS
ncbi:MAG: phosphatase PAP2 family protein [Actinomycetes bacterium]